MEYMEVIKMLGPWVFAGGAAWGGIKVGLNGQKEKLDDVEEKRIAAQSYAPCQVWRPK
jgi:hypothetical protein